MTPPTMAEALDRAKRGELLGPAEMRVIYRLGRTKFAQRLKNGDFDRLRSTQAIGRTCFSGTLVHKDITGEPIYQPTFGRRRA